MREFFFFLSRSKCLQSKAALLQSPTKCNEVSTVYRVKATPFTCEIKQGQILCYNKT